MEVIINDSDCFPFPKWIYKNESILYTNDNTKHKKNIKSITASVVFTNDEIIAINQALTVHKQISEKYITDDFIERLSKFAQQFNCPAIESITSPNITTWIVKNDCSYLINHIPGNKSKYFDAALRLGSLNIIKWYSKNYNELFTPSTMDWAADYGHLEIIKWLHANGYNGTTDAMNYASLHGYLNIVKWLHANGYNCTTDAMDYAAENGHLNVVKWLHVMLWIGRA